MTVASAGVASAGSLGGISSTTVAAGSSSVLRCDADGVSVAYSTSGGAVTAVTVGGISDPGCEGATLYVTLTNATSERISAGGPTTVAVDGDMQPNSVEVPVDARPAATQVAAYHVVLIGP